MNINWYPGHMAKAKNTISRDLKLIDLILEIRDARIPQSSANPDFEDLFLHKSRIVFLNKEDLADPSSTKAWINWFKGQGIKALGSNSLNVRNMGKVKDSILELAGSIFEERLKRRGIRKTIRGMVIGIPNVGKSAFINGIARNKKAKTGNIPGITKGQQWIKINPYLELMDTPGLLWPRLDQREVALKLAFTRTIKEEILDIEEISHIFLERAKIDFPNALKEKYGDLNMNLKGYEILEEICMTKGWIQAGNKADLNRGSKHILDDFQQGKLGRISLELPQSD